MCGRFTLATPKEALAALFGVDSTDRNHPRFNIAPQVRIVTVRREKEKRMAQSLLWGAVNPRDGRPLINARSETVATSSLFGPAFVAARVLVPADGFFEWTKDGALKVAHYFQQPGGRPFAFAGIAVAAANEDMEARLGLVDGKASRARAIVLRNNGIVKRYYAMDAQGKATHTNAALAAEAVKRLAHGGIRVEDFEVLACGTSAPDQLLPAHASQVHGLLPHALEIISPSGACASGMHAFKFAI